jgi:predicted esterase
LHFCKHGPEQGRPRQRLGPGLKQRRGDIRAIRSRRRMRRLNAWMASTSSFLSGGMDPIVPAESAAGLATLLDRAGVAEDHRVLPAGHGLSQADVAITRAWLDGLSG